MSRSFTDVAAAFLDRASRTGSRHGTPYRHRQHEQQIGALHDRQSCEPRAGCVGVYCHQEHMQRELARPFKVLPASLKRIQLHFGQSVAEWYSALPAAAKVGHGQLRQQVRSLEHTLVRLEVTKVGNGARQEYAPCLIG